MSDCERCDGRGWHPALVCVHRNYEDTCEPCANLFPDDGKAEAAEMLCTCPAGQRLKARYDFKVRA